MVNISIKNIKLFEVLDEAASKIYCGGWQKWYGAWWKRLSGCGPTTVSNIMSYLSRSRSAPEALYLPLPISNFRELMDDVWKYVTPGMHGIPTTAALKKGASAYIAAKKLDISLESVDIPKKKELRPDFLMLIDFLSVSILNDAPVAFLSLDKGGEPLLDSWHWVTLLSLAYEPDGSAAFAEIADEGQLLRVDLKKWFDTTGLGGGFVRFVQ